MMMKRKKNVLTCLNTITDGCDHFGRRFAVGKRDLRLLYFIPVLKASEQMPLLSSHGILTSTILYSPDRMFYLENILLYRMSHKNDSEDD